MFKITDLDKLQKNLKGAQFALSELDGELGIVHFDPNDPDNIEFAIQTVNRMIDERLDEYSSNPIVGTLAEQMKEKYRESILEKAAEARLQPSEGVMARDIFSEINNVVLDLQAAQLQTFERPLKKLAQLLRHPDLDVYNTELTKGLDLEGFISESEKTAGSMVGSAKLAWPDDPKEMLGLTLLLIEKLAAEPGYATNFAYQFFYSGNKIVAAIRALTGQLVIPFVRDYKSYIQTKGGMEPMLKAQLSSKVFVVHGHDDAAREKVARFLEQIGLEAIILHEQANRGRTIIEKIDAHSDVGFAVVLLTPDDEGCVKGGTPEPRVRQNVLLELGFFIGRLGRNKVCALKRGEVEIPSDFDGVVWETMDSAGAWKQALARELEAAGHSIDWNRVMR